MSRLRLSKKTIKFLTTTAISALVILTSYFKVFETFELATLDLRFKHRPPQRLSDQIVIIEIAQDTLNQIGQWPIDRAFYAALIDILTAYGARAVIFDMLFSQDTASDRQFIESAEKNGRVYVASALRLSEEKKKAAFPEAVTYESEPLPALKKACRGVGHINIITDIDGKRRKIPLFVNYKGNLIPQLSFLAVCDYLGVPVEEAAIERGRYIQLTPELKIPIDANGQTLINFAGRWGEVFKHYSFIDILKSYLAIHKQKPAAVDLSQLRNKICLVGLTAVATHDLNPIPLQERYPMIGLHANLINTILTKGFIVRANPLVNILILVLLSMAAALVVFRLRPVPGTLLALGIFFGFILVAFALFGYFYIWIDLFYPLLLISAVYIFCTFCKYIAERNKRLLMEKELDIAKRIQKSFLRETPPRTRGLDMAVMMTPAKAVGGDLYDFVEVKDEVLGIMVGDVSGKGMPAALFMAKTISDFRFHAKQEKEPLKVVTELNNQISTESSSGLFVTLSYLVIDTEAKKLYIVNAGHLPPVYAGRDKETSFIASSGGMAAGIMDGVEFGKRELSIESDDVFVLYTDGVTEARNTKREEFTAERLKEAVSRYKGLEAQGLARSVYEELSRFMKKAPQHDDITIVVIKVK